MCGADKFGNIFITRLPEEVSGQVHKYRALALYPFHNQITGSFPTANFVSIKCETKAEDAEESAPLFFSLCSSIR